MSRGKFITLEGVDGAGKSTHLEWLAGLVKRRGQDVVLTREPGGTRLGEELRTLLLGQSMHIDTEILLMFAARREHMAQVILPALEAGKWVISDRFTDATFAYQGGGREVPLERIAVLENWVQGDFQPDLTLVFHVSVEIAEQRRGGRAGGDRFEQLDKAFFERVSEQYLSRAAKDPGRMRIIDASRSLSDIQKELEQIILSV